MPDFICFSMFFSCVSTIFILSCSLLRACHVFCNYSCSLSWTILVRILLHASWSFTKILELTNFCICYGDDELIRWLPLKVGQTAFSSTGFGFGPLRLLFKTRLLATSPLSLRVPMSSVSPALRPAWLDLKVSIFRSSCLLLIRSLLRNLFVRCFY